VLVFTSEDPDYFISHVDLTRVEEYRAEAARLAGEPSIALLFHYLSASRLVTIAQIEGRVRGAGSEFVLACDMRFASRENAVLGQFEVGSGVVPGGGPMARLSRLVGRGRALEILLVADDMDGPRAEQYGYVNRLIADDQLDDEVDAIAFRVARFDHDAIARTKSYIDRVSLRMVQALPDV
jgi:enoyl-CoA hydratase/carnithine racemase